MSRIKLLVADNDIAYSRCLVDYLANKHSDIFSISCYHSIKTLDIQKSDADAILLSESYYLEYSQPISELPIIVLSDTDTGRKNSIKHICRYQHANRIASLIVAFYNENNSLTANINISRSCSLFCVYSPHGGAGKTAVSLALSTRCSLVGLRTLYLNLETLNSVTNFFSEYRGEGMSKILYSIMSAKNDIKSIIQAQMSFTDMEGLACIKQAQNSLELDEADTDTIATLLMNIKRIDNIDVVIIDLDSSFINKFVSILKLCDAAFILHSEKSGTVSKSQQFNNQISLNDKNGYLSSKMIHVLNDPYNSCNNSIQRVISSSISYQIPYCKQIAMAKNCASLTGYNSDALEIVDKIVKAEIVPMMKRGAESVVN